MSTSKSSEKVDRKGDEAKSDSKKSKSRASDQHKRDSKVSFITAYPYRISFVVGEGSLHFINFLILLGFMQIW